MPKVSVVLPTYNRAHVLTRAVDSVLTQTFRDFELIIVDDGSTDATQDVLAQYNAPQVRTIRLSTNAGACHARNIGITASCGEFVAFHDSDDEWLPNKLAVQIERLEAVQTMSRKVGASYSRVISKRDGIFRLYFPPYSDELTFRGNIYSQLLQKNLVDTPTLVVRREVLTEVQLFDEELPWLQDWDLALRIAQHYDFDFVEQPLIISNWSDTGIHTRNDPRAHYRILTKHLKAYEQYFPQIGANAFCNVGDQLMKAGYVSLGKASLSIAVRLSPKFHILLARLGSHGGSTAYKKLSQIFGKTAQ